MSSIIFFLDKQREPPNVSIYCEKAGESLKANSQRLITKGINLQLA